MPDITKYAVAKNPSEWGDAPTYDQYADAKAEAQAQCACVIELTYSFDDSELVDDFREDETEEEDDRLDAVASRLSRDECVRLLEAACIQCYLDEDTVTLREAVAENLKDGTISESDIEEG
jgi:hypothetical protein